MLRKVLHAALLFVLVLGLFVGALVAQDSDGHDDDAEVTPEAMAEEEPTHDDIFVPQAIIDALTIGDPERGEELFNTPIEGLGLACSGCHRVDSVEVLVGPGLLETAALSHDHLTHADPAEEADSGHGSEGMPMGGHGSEGMPMGGHGSEGMPMGGHGSEGMPMGGHGSEGMPMGGRGSEGMPMGDNGHEDAEATPEADSEHGQEETVTSEEEREALAAERVEYIYTSIVDPNAFVARGMPANVMPQNLAELFTEQEINDLVAYIVSLSWGTLEDIEAAQMENMDAGAPHDDENGEAHND